MLGSTLLFVFRKTFNFSKTFSFSKNNKLNQEFGSQGDLTYRYFFNILKFVVETFFLIPPIATPFPHVKSTILILFQNCYREKHVLRARSSLCQVEGYLFPPATD